MTNQTVAVAIDVPLQQIFHYALPEDTPAPAPGCRVRVPFGRSQRIGLVWANSPAPEGLALKSVSQVIDAEPLLQADAMAQVVFAARYYRHAPGEVAAAALPLLLRQAREASLEETRWHWAADHNDALITLKTRAPRQYELATLLTAHPDGLSDQQLNALMPNWRRSANALQAKRLLHCSQHRVRFNADTDTATQPARQPTEDQRQAIETIRSANEPRTWLLDGVTGSGKTEVYLQLMQAPLQRGQQVLILVPEIGLVPQLASRAEARFGTRVALLHSDMSDAARAANWLAARAGEARIVLGTRSAVFTPMADLGLLIVDEEHDASLKQQEGFRYHARDLAVWRAHQINIPCVLGSATPSLETLGNVELERYGRCALTSRAGAAATPAFRVVDTNQWPSQDGLATPTIDAIGQHLEAGQQVLVFLNRRGFAPTVVCKQCGQMAECSHCDARMTFHREDQSLRCHHCGARSTMPPRCGDCDGDWILVGTGTERIDEALAAHFPKHPSLRIDADTMQQRNALPIALARAKRGEARILVGTQMLAKGHHLPDVTLVVIINADQGLFSCDFRGSERLAQTIVQVAGRAGRAEQPGEVVIQTAFPEHALLTSLLSEGYAGFAQRLLIERQAAGWPPLSHLAVLHAAARNEQLPLSFLEQMANALQQHGISALGPAPASMFRRRNQYRYQLLLQAPTRARLQSALSVLTQQLGANPPPSTLRWSLDVDPISVL